jgi:hypothetical protein
VWGFIEGRSELASEREGERTVKPAPRTARAADGGIIVTLDPETRQRIALKTAILTSEHLEPEVAAYGTLEPDPAATFTVRAPTAGLVRVARGRQWPGLGETLHDGTVVGAIEPPLAPTVQVDLASRLAATRAELDAVTASLAANRAALQRARTLNAEDKIVSDRSVQEAEARVKGDEARLRALAETARLLGDALPDGSQDGSGTAPRATAVRPLVVGRGGEVVEALVQPGEIVESGQPLLRVTRFDRLMARVHLPAGEDVDRPVSTARIVVFGHDKQPLRGERIALGATVDSTSRGQTFLFRVRASGFPLRPGAAVTAYLPTAGESRQGVVIPRSAIVRLEGKAWAYVQVGDTGFARREITLDHATDEGWFVSDNVASGDRVVVRGAQTLLSEEYKAQIPISEEGD